MGCSLGRSAGGGCCCFCGDGNAPCARRGSDRCQPQQASYAAGRPHSPCGPVVSVTCSFEQKREREREREKGRGSERERDKR